MQPSACICIGRFIYFNMELLQAGRFAAPGQAEAHNSPSSRKRRGFLGQFL
jgi:hypothetical protein